MALPIGRVERVVAPADWRNASEALERSCSVVATPASPLCHREIEPRVAQLRIGADSFLPGIDCAPQVARLKMDDTEAVPGSRLLRVELDGTLEPPA